MHFKYKWKSLHFPIAYFKGKYETHTYPCQREPGDVKIPEEGSKDKKKKKKKNLGGKKHILIFQIPNFSQ